MSFLARPFRTSVAALAAAAVVAGPLAVVTAGSASAAEREGRCDGAERTLEVEREDGNRFEVNADIDDATPGSRWKVVLKHNGKTFVNGTYRADGDGEVSIDRDRRNTPGADVFVMTVNKVGTGGSCSHTIRFAR